MIDHAMLGVHYVRPQLEMGQNPYGVVRAYAIMVYRHTHLYSTVDGQLASGHNWDPKQIASCSATNNTSFVPWLLDVFSTLMPFSNLKSVVTLPGWSARFFAWWIRHRFWFLLGSQTSRQFWAHPDWRCRAHERCHLTTGYIWLPKSGVLPVPLLCWTSTYLLMAPQSHHNDALEWPRFNQFGTTLNETITRDFGRYWIDASIYTASMLYESRNFNLLFVIQLHKAPP